MNVALYLRVSTHEQDVSAQRIELTEYCRRQNWTVVGEWSDVMSGTRAARPGLDALLMECSASRVEAIVVVKLDRLGRSVMNTVGLIGRLDAMGVAVICTSQGIDTRKSNPASRLIFHVLAAVAEMERAMIVERTVAGMVAAKARGKTLGRPSPTMVAEGWRAGIVERWRAEGRKGGLRGLAARLGNVSPTTAQIIERRYPARVQAVVSAPADVVQEPESPSQGGSVVGSSGEETTGAVLPSGA